MNLLLKNDEVKKSVMNLPYNSIFKILLVLARVAKPHKNLLSERSWVESRLRSNICYFRTC